jgi:transcriptional regulator with XRE-family HTH domain
METDFAARLRAARCRRRLPQGEVAERAFLDPSAISHFEGGHRAPSLANLRKLALAVGVSTDYLLGLSDNIGAASDPVLCDRIGRLTDQDRRTIARMVDSMEASASDNRATTDG